MNKSKEVRETEQPREPKFYSNEQQSIFIGGKESNTLQSIDNTLKRIEKIIIQSQNQSGVSGDPVLRQQRSEGNLVG